MLPTVGKTRNGIVVGHKIVVEIELKRTSNEQRIQNGTVRDDDLQVSVYQHILTKGFRIEIEIQLARPQLETIVRVRQHVCQVKGVLPLNFRSRVGQGKGYILGTRFGTK